MPGPDVPWYEAALLVDLLKGGAPAPDPATDWEALRRIAAENGVLAHVHEALLETGVEIPADFSRLVRERKAAAMRLAMDLRELLQAFGEGNIDALPLKGPALSLALYGDAAMRFSYDLDVLVRREDHPRAAALLISKGFAPAHLLAEYEQSYVRDGLVVDLHQDLSERRYQELDTGAIWNRAQPTRVFDAPAYALSRQDLALYLICHAGKHGFARFDWTFDIARALQGWDDPEYGQLLDLARQQGLEPWLLFGCEYLRLVLPDHLPKALDNRIASCAGRQRAAAAAVRIISAAPTQAITDYRVIYLWIESRPWKRLRCHLNHLRPTGIDREWMRQHRLPVRLSAVFRPFRLLSKYGVRQLWRTLFQYE